MVWKSKANRKALGLSEATAKRHWSYARAWLYEALQRSN